MGSRVISFRVPDDRYKEFERKCQDEEINPTAKLREYVDSVCHQDTPGNTQSSGDNNKAQVKVIEVEEEKVDKVSGKDSKKKSWFPLDFSPLFGKD